MIWITFAISSACLITSLLPFVPHSHGIFRVWEFPRIQILCLGLFSSATAFVFLNEHPLLTIAIGFALFAAVVQLAHILRFTPFWRRRSAEFRGDIEETPVVRLLITNVKMGNRDYQQTIDLVSKHNPDIAVFMETDQPWIDDLAGSVAHYKYKMECPISNGYGLMVVSKFRFVEHQVRYLLNPEVPSFDATIDHPDGALFRLFVVHPEPPIASGDTVGRDAEIAFVAKLVRHDEQPVIVTGDLNDVAWSRTTRRFLRVSRLLDPREGRGQFNTFDARFFFLRWPLDHIFHSPHFQLANMQRLPFTGSDHFPMLYELALTDNTVGRRVVDAATNEDLEEAKELIAEEASRDRKPVGHDWEEKIPDRQRRLR